MEFSTVVEAKKKRVCTGVCIYVCVCDFSLFMTSNTSD